MKIICMIPARLGSKRVKKKNLRLINGIPLISYVIKTLSKSNIFDEIYLNSEASIFEKISKENKIKFYKRSKKLSSDKSTNDEFALDFVNNTNGDILIQVLPTSPLITLNEIENFVKYMLNKKLDTLISVSENKIASVYKNKPVNFKKLKQNPPSQKMEPVYSYATVLMGWKYKVFKKNMSKFKSAYHGGNGRTEYFTLSPMSCIDIDNEEDFQIVEKIILSKNINNNKPRYYK